MQLWATVSSIDQEKACGVTYQSNLSYHSSAVNALRFSPSGKFSCYFSLICKGRHSVSMMQLVYFDDDTLSSNNWVFKNISLYGMWSKTSRGFDGLLA